MIGPGSRDRRLILGATCVRALATGMIGVLLGLYLAELDLGATWIGFVVGCGLAGATCATAIVTLAARRLGHKRALVVVTVLAAIGAIGLVFASHPVAIALTAFIGMANGMGRDRGAALVVEQSMLPATVGDADRTRAFAIYNVLQDAGHAAGGLLAALPAALAGAGAAPGVRESRLAMGIYALLSLAPVFFYARLSPAVEPAAGQLIPAISPRSRSILLRISALFALDALGGGFLTAALLAYFFRERFGADVALIGTLFFAARIANAGSHLAAAWLAKRIGLVNTMVFTHLPSSLLLVTVGFAPSFPVAAALFLLRESLVEMDVPTRQSYVLAVVAPEERTFASGATHLVRLGGWAAAPVLAGLAIERWSLAAPLLAAAGIKIAYDLLLWRSFRRIKPPEEEGDR